MELEKALQKNTEKESCQVLILCVILDYTESQQNMCLTRIWTVTEHQASFKVCKPVSAGKGKEEKSNHVNFLGVILLFLPDDDEYTVNIHLLLYCITCGWVFTDIHTVQRQGFK